MLSLVAAPGARNTTLVRLAAIGVQNMMETEPDRAAPALAPLRQPHNLKPIRIITQLRRDIPQVACFDTMCHNMWTDASKARYQR